MDMVHGTALGSSKQQTAAQTLLSPQDGQGSRQDSMNTRAARAHCFLLLAFLHALLFAAHAFFSHALCFTALRCCCA